MEEIQLLAQATVVPLLRLFQAVQVGLLVGKPAADYPILRDAGVWLKEYLDEKGDEEALDQNPVEKKEEIPF